MSLDFWAAAAPELAKPLTRDHVKKREQSGRTFSYIEGWHAIAEANRIFGFGAWTRETIDVRCVAEKPRKIGSAGRDGFSVSYVVKVRITVEGVLREGVGAGHGIDADLGLAHESAVKEAETDAMKRALMTFGNPFGLALYDKAQASVADAPPNPVVGALITSIRMAQTTDDLTEWTEKNKAALAQLAGDDRAMVRDAYSEHRTKLAEAEYQHEQKDAAE